MSKHSHHPTEHAEKVNIGALKKGYVNIAVHGHLPTLVSQIVKTRQEEKFIELAKSKGAKGIRFGSWRY